MSQVHIDLPAGDLPPPQRVRRGWGQDLGASLVVFLIALPLSMGVALAAGVPIAAGLVAAIIGGLLVGLISGSPLQVSGPTAGSAVIIFEIVRNHGLESLGIVVLLAGLVQLLAAALRLGQWFRAVSPAVVQGMLAGIGVLIVANQFHVMVDDNPHGSAVQNIATIPSAIAKGLPLPRLGSPEEREARAQLLHSMGTLHSEQLQIFELVSQYVPRDQAPEHVPEEVPALRELVTLQTNLRDDVQRVLDRVTGDSSTWRTNPDYNKVKQRLESAQVAVAAALTDLETGHGPTVRETQTVAIESLFSVEQALKNHDWAAKIGLLTITLIVLWRFVRIPFLRRIPEPIVAISVATAVAASLSLPVLYVEVPANLLNDLHSPTFSVLRELDWAAVATSAIVIACVASAETLLCCSAIDTMQTRVKTNYDGELFAQGVGNLVAGALGALPVTGVIVRSAANIRSGARSRLSTILHGLWVLLFVWQLSDLLQLIPTSALAAMLVYTGFRLVNASAIQELWRFGKGEVLVYAVTLIVVVVQDLLVGVLAGIVVSAARLLLTFTKFEAEVLSDSPEEAELRLRGASTFIRLPKLLQALDRIPRGSHVRWNVDDLTYLDHAGQQIILNWLKRHADEGGRVSVHWERLRIHGRLREHVIEQYRCALNHGNQDDDDNEQK